MTEAPAARTISEPTPEEPVTAGDQMDIAAKEGQVNQAANLKRSAPEAGADSEDIRKKVKAFLG